LLGRAPGALRSRLRLGRHWPPDLVGATLISGLLGTLATWLAQRICGPLMPPREEAQEIAEREQES
ncbi:phosphatidylglycerophosphatase B, partial [Salmonella enterica subsp. enterica serovar Wilhelmsburg]